MTGTPIKAGVETSDSKPCLCHHPLKGSLRHGNRAAAIMGLIQSVRLNGHDPYAYLKYVLARLPTQWASKITELLPHNWPPT